jgi:hypothetical protein
MTFFSYRHNLPPGCLPDDIEDETDTVEAQLERDAEKGDQDREVAFE